MEYLPHQQRVIDEMNYLDIKINALESFIYENNIFSSLDIHEQHRLIKQLHHMELYRSILLDRINHFII